MSTGRLFSITARRNGAIISKVASSLRGRVAAQAPLSQLSFGGNGTLSQRWMSSYPDHEVVGMPSLSPVSITTKMLFDVQHRVVFFDASVACAVNTRHANYISG